MTITVAPTKYRYQGNGVTATFSYPNRVYVPTDLKVDILTRTTSALVETLTLTTDYSVTIAVNGQATVTITNAIKIPSGTQDILVRLDLPKSQSLELPTGTPFPAASVEGGLDKITTITQVLEEVDSRTLKYAPQSPVTDTSIAEPVADAALAFDGTTGKIKAGPTTTDIADAASNAAIASAAAIDAAASAAKLTGTSATSLAIGTGGKSFTTQADKFFTPGIWLLATSDADPTNYMHGYVSSYSGTSLVMVVTNVGGSGTHADWTIRVSGTRGATGANGSNGSNGATPNRNLIINSQFAINQRAASSVADDVYGFDRWYALTQTNTVTVSAQTDQENGQPRNLRITQPHATAQRIGHAQIVESLNCRQLRGGNAVFSGRFRSSSAQAIRFAILEWTGTADSVTSDVVNDWTSGTYTAGNFFLGSNITVTAVAAVTPSANTWTDFSVSGAVSASANNIIVMAWTEGTFAQNETLDLGLCQLEVGSTRSAFDYRPISDELALCQYYLPVITNPGSGGSQMLAITQAYNTTTVVMALEFPVSARTRPTGVTVSNLSHFGLWNASGTAAATDSITFVSATFEKAYLEASRTGGGLVAGNASGFISQNASASLIFTGCEL